MGHQDHQSNEWQPTGEKHNSVSNLLSLFIGNFKLGLLNQVSIKPDWLTESDWILIFTFTLLLIRILHIQNNSCRLLNLDTLYFSWTTWSKYWRFWFRTLKLTNLKYRCDMNEALTGECNSWNDVMWSTKERVYHSVGVVWSTGTLSPLVVLPAVFQSGGSSLRREFWLTSTCKSSLT